jgi:predicted DNA-binding transcriptional regulator YafY
VEQIISDAIRGRKVLTVRYRNTNRVVEPYLLYETKDGEVTLHGWQVSGGSRLRADWCNLRISEISNATPTGQVYTQPHQGYKPSSSQFHLVLCSV